VRNELIESLIATVAERDQCLPEEVAFYSWPQNFETTCGSLGGASGNMISTFQVYAFSTPKSHTRICCGFWRRWNGEFQQKW
jgi:hypothetical protein